MKKLILSALVLSILLSITSCKKDPDAICGEEALFLRSNGWKPIGLTVDTTDNNNDDGQDYFQPCHLDNYEIAYANGTTYYNNGGTPCSNTDFNGQKKWWWDPSVSCQSAFFYKDMSGHPDTTTKYCNILKLTNDTFRYSMISDSFSIRVNGILIRTFPRTKSIVTSIAR